MEAKAPIRPETSILPREILRTLPKIGSIVEIFIDKVFGGIYLLKADGHWIKFYNIIFNIQSGGWRGAKFVSFLLKILMYYTKKEFMKIVLHLTRNACLFQAFLIHL